MAILCGNKHENATCTSTQDCTFSLLVVCCVMLTVADTSNYSTEEHLVAGVWAPERQHTGQTMNQVLQQ
jgi:hypothetical protein